MRANVLVTTLTAMFLVSLSNQSARTQIDERLGENIVLPDSFYISQRCSETKDRLKWLKKDKAPAAIKLRAKVDMKSAETVASEIALLCDKVGKKEISSDSWLEQFEKKSDAFEQLTDACGRIVLCAKIFVPPAKPIPANFKAYSLFLFPSSEWDKTDRQNDLRKIRTAFSGFGDSIGNTQAAIWLSKDSLSIAPDVQRSKYYCDLFKLNYNAGPFVMTSLKRPDMLATKTDLVVIKLGGISADRVVRILNILEQDLRTHADFRKRALIYEEIKQRLLSVADRNPEIVKEIAKGAIGLVTK